MFEYVRAMDVDAAVAAVSADPTASYLAGGVAFWFLRRPAVSRG